MPKFGDKLVLPKGRIKKTLRKQHDVAQPHIAKISRGQLNFFLYQCRYATYYTFDPILDVVDVTPKQKMIPLQFISYKKGRSFFHILLIILFYIIISFQESMTYSFLLQPTDVCCLLTKYARRTTRKCVTQKYYFI